MLSNEHCIFCSINLIQVLTCQNHTMDVFMLPNRTFTNPSQLIKPTELMKELKIDFWCFSSTGFRGSFSWTCPYSWTNQEKALPKKRQHTITGMLKGHVWCQWRREWRRCLTDEDERCAERLYAKLMQEMMQICHGYFANHVPVGSTLIVLALLIWQRNRWRKQILFARDVNHNSW